MLAYYIVFLYNKSHTAVVNKNFIVNKLKALKSILAIQFVCLCCEHIQYCLIREDQTKVSHSNLFIGNTYIYSYYKGSNEVTILLWKEKKWSKTRNKDV